MTDVVDEPEAPLSAWQLGAKKMWVRRHAQNLEKKKTPDNVKRKIRDSLRHNREGKQHVIDRMHRLEAVIKTFGYSDQEVRMM